MGLARRSVDRCPYCRADGVARHWTLRDRMFGGEDRFVLAACAGCGTRYLRDPPADLGAAYPQADYYSFELPAGVRGAPTAASSAHRLRRALGSVLRARLVDPDWDAALLATGPGRLLDIGCGAGAALDRYGGAGWKTFGVEVDEAAAATARSAGHQVFHDASWARAPHLAGLDAVRLRHVIEHVPDPLGVLTGAWELLRPGGRIAVEWPNADGLLARLGGPDYWQLDAPRHLSLPSAATMRRALEEIGYVVDRSFCYSHSSGLAHTMALRRHAAHLLSAPATRWVRLVSLLGQPLANLTDLLRAGDNSVLLAHKP